MRSSSPAPNAGGAPRGVDPREPRRDPVLARRVRARGPGARTRAEARRRRPRGPGAGLAVPRRHRAVDPGRRQARGRAARRRARRGAGLGDPWTLARTLLVAAWAPYFRQEVDTARAMFQEALDTARANPEGDRWSEARSLVGLSTLESDEGDEESSLRLAAEALAVAGDERGPLLARGGARGGRRHDAPHDAAGGCRGAHGSLGRRVPRARRALGARERAHVARHRATARRPGRGRRQGSPRGVPPLPRAEGAEHHHLDGERARPGARQRG